MENLPPFEPGDIVAGLEPLEHVEVQSLQPFGSKWLLKGVTLDSRRAISRPLEDADLARLSRVRGAEHAFDGDGEAFLLGVEALRICNAYQFDPLFAVNSSVVDVLPHQVEAVYRFLLPLPRIRFLLADDTGAGKTIMTGLLLKELLFRGVIEKMLIITPGGLTKQWAEELREKFGLESLVVNGDSFASQPGMFARSEGLFITSVDFISRNEGALSAACEAQWDFVAVDEAHKLSAYEYGTKVDRSARYSAVEKLAPRTDHLLLLTATPHRGRRDTFRRLMMLLDSDLFGQDDLVTAQVQRRKIGEGERHNGGEEDIERARNRFFLRRLKEEMLDWNEGPLFKPRHTKSPGYELTAGELELYNAVTHYVRSHRKEAVEKKNRNVELTLLVMQRRLASSLYAITRTLSNRLESLDKVQEILRDPDRSLAEKQRLLRGESGEETPADISQYEELDETQRAQVDRRIFGQVLSSDPEAVAREREEVRSLVEMAKALRGQPEAKFDQLLRVLDESDIIRSEKEKLVIFTEHKDTLLSLQDRLSAKGYNVVTIDGSMGPDARKEAQRQFFQSAKILIATDAAGEGINLQFCRFLINWDIPWNPNRLEQRMGRIHRYGQTQDVWVYNLVATNTREGAVLKRLLDKLDVMREQMGSDRVYDVIDELLEDVPLVKLVERSIDAPTEAVAQNILDEASAKIERAATGVETLVESQRLPSLASPLNMASARELRDASDEHRLQPCFVQNFFERAWKAAGGTLRGGHDDPIYHLGATPPAVLKVAAALKLPVGARSDTPFVFDKSLLSVASPLRVGEHTRLLGPGHPLFVALAHWAIGHAREAWSRGAVVVDPGSTTPHRLWLVRSSVADGRSENKKRLAHQELGVIMGDDAGTRVTSAANLLNFTAPAGLVAPSDIPADPPPAATQSEDAVQMWAYENITEAQKQRVEESRQNECELRRDYLQTAFTFLIVDVQEKLEVQHGRLLLDKADREEIARLEKHLTELKARKQTRLEELELMRNLTADLPEVLTTAWVLPAPQSALPTVEEGGAVEIGSAHFPMRRDDEVERIAMDVAMNYERARGWFPLDVSADGEHYDVRSGGPEGQKRFIEVKGRAQSGPIMLTGPEVDKLRQLGERAFLYIVTFCRGAQGQKPHLQIICDPIRHLSPHEMFRQVQYLVEEGDWKKAGETAALEPNDTVETEV